MTTAITLRRPSTSSANARRVRVFVVIVVIVVRVCREPAPRPAHGTKFVVDDYVAGRTDGLR